MSYENADLRNLAQNRPCQLLAPGVVDHPEGTSVWAHSNLQEHGKGKGIKAHDAFGAIACRACHAWLDESGESAEVKRAAFIAGMHRTWLYLWTSGLIGVVRQGTPHPRPHTAPTVSKVLPRNLPRYGVGVSQW